MQNLSDRIYALLIERGVTAADVDPRAVLLAVELADRAMVVAYRGREDFDDDLLELGRFAVDAYVASMAANRLGRDA